MTTDSYLMDEEQPKEISENVSGREADQVKKKESELFLFYSFDIVNSSHYKTITRFWPIIITELLVNIIKKVEDDEKLDGTKMWRSIGDEIIFVKKIGSKSDLRDSIDAIFYVIQILKQEMKKHNFFTNISHQGLTKEEIDTLEKQNLLSVKAAAWVSSVNEKNENPFDSISYHYKSYSMPYSILEFQGSDIDTGFRMKAYSQKDRLTVSFELAYLLKNCVNMLHIISYEVLKDVWNGRPYPIIWYHNENTFNKFDEEAVKFENSFQYFDWNNDLILKYLERERKNDCSGDLIKDYKMYKSETALDKVLQDMNLETKMEYFKGLIQNSTPDAIKINKSKVELQIVVVCVKDKNKVMILKRGNTYTTNADKWEYGNVIAYGDGPIKEGIVDYYKENYNVEIELVCDKEWDDQPIPLKIYENATRPFKKGIILYANIIKAEKFRVTTGLVKREFYTLKQLETIKTEDAVKDFYKTAKMVLDEVDKEEKKKEKNNKNKKKEA